MAHHTIVAFRYTEKGGKGTLEALTASPRGTRIPFQVARFEVAGLKKAELIAVLEREITTMEAQSADPQ